MNIEQVTAEFGKVYQEAKDKNDAKADLQKSLFKAFDQDLTQRTLSRQVIEIEFTHQDDDLTAHVAKWLPGWRIVTQTEDQETDTWCVVVEEDPSLMKHTYINRTDGHVYGRKISQGAPTLDEESFRIDCPDLWEKITTWPEPWYSLCRDAIQSQHFITDNRFTILDSELDSETDRFLTERGIEKVLSNLGAVTEEEWTVIQEYMIPSPISVSLMAPRPAKPEELEELEELEDNE